MSRWLLASRFVTLLAALVAGVGALLAPAPASRALAGVFTLLTAEAIVAGLARAVWWRAGGPLRRLGPWEAAALSATGLAVLAWVVLARSASPLGATLAAAGAWLGAAALSFLAVIQSAARRSMWLLPRDPVSGVAPREATVLVRSEQDIVDAVRRAAREGAVVRAVGSRNGSAPYRVPAADDTRFILLDLSAYGEVISLDVAGRRIHVQAGMQQRHLCAALEAAGLALPATNGSGWLTIGGTLTTGSLCGSRFLLNDQVLALTVVEADGAVRRVAREDADFGAWLCSLGVLGVLSSVELEAVPTFIVEGAVDKVDFDTMMARSTAEQVRALDYTIHDWYPAVDQVVSRRLSRRPPEEALARRVPMPSMTPAESLLGQALTLLVNRVPALGPPSVRLFLAGFQPVQASARWFELVAVDPHFDFAYHPVDYLELIVPVARYPEVMEALRAHYRAHPASIPMVPVITDWVAPDPRAWIIKNAANPGDDSPFAVITVAYQLLEARPRGAVFDPVAAIGRRFGARMHWGKSPWMDDPAAIAATLPEGNFARFAQLRAARDPEGRFLNGYFRSVFPT